MIARPELGAVITAPGRELAALVSAARQSWRAGRRPFLGVLGCALSVLVTAAYAHRGWRSTVDHLGAVRADLPLRSELGRLALSAFVPTPGLPVAAAALQILIVVGLAELLLGRLALLGLAASSQLLCTLAARELIGMAGIGLPLSQASVLDTGPSVITAALGAWLLIRLRAFWCLGLLTVALLLGAGLQDNLDGREHLIALGCAVALPVVGTFVRRAAGRRGSPG